MKILVIGSGGREHALVWKIAQSKKIEKIYCAPGNSGTTEFAINIPIQSDKLNQLAQFAEREKIDLTIVGPEAPLIDGIVDLFNKNKLPIIGPSKKAAQIEGSKVFAKILMKKYGIPTAKFEVFNDYIPAFNFIKNQKYPLVIKADGLCAGKGVSVCQNKHQAEVFLKKLMKDKIFGRSGDKIIIEECLTGQEVSFMVASDGKDFVSLLPSQDHKNVNENDKGSNTGGMGAYTPIPYLSKKLVNKIEKEIVAPTITAMYKEGFQYKGILYPGLILTREGPKVLEYNCRFGDPETQPLMMLLNTDLIDLFQAILKEKLAGFKLRWYNGSAVCVVLAAKGYPDNYKKGHVITFARRRLAKVDRKSLAIFHGGTKKADGKIITDGGRVIGVTARGKNLGEAINTVYKYIGKKGINFSGMHYRQDIGMKGLVKRLWV